MTVMLSRPEEPALEDVVALAVDLVDPPGEVDQQLVEALLQEGAVGLARRGCGPCCRRARPPRRAPAGSGRRTPTRRRGSGPTGAGTARRAAARAAPWRTPGRRGPAATQWKARSQAANQGYSHLSGIDRIAHRVEMAPVGVADLLARRGRRPAAGCRPRATGSRRRGRSASSTACPAKACRWTSFSSSVACGGLDGRVELVGLGLALGHDARPRRRAGRRARSGVRRRRRVTEPPGGHHAAEVRRSALVPDLVGVHGVLAVDDVAVERVLDVGPAALRPRPVDPRARSSRCR